MALATLSIDVEARLAGLEAGLDKAARISQQSADKIERSFDGIKSIGAGLAGTLAAAFSVSAISLFVRSTLDGIDALNDLKDATGASIENLSALEDIAARTGTSFDSVGQALTKFNAVLNEAKPNSEQERVLKAIGLSAQELRKIDPAEALQQVAEALGGYADKGNKARIVQDLFGKSVREVAPFLKDLAEAGRLNGTVTSEQAQEAEKFNNQLAALSKNSKDAARALLNDLLPALNQIFERSNRAGGFFAMAASGFKVDWDQARLQAFSDQIQDLTGEAIKLQKQLDFSESQGLPQNRDTVARLAEVRRELLELQEKSRIVGDQVKGIVSQVSPPTSGRRPRNEGGGKYIPPDAPVIGGAPRTDSGRRLYSDATDEAMTRALKSFENTDVKQIRELEAELTRLFDLQRETRGDPAVVAALERTQEAIAKLRLPSSAIFDPQEQQKQDFLRSEKSAYEEIKYEIEALDEFAKQAGRNIQDALGDTLARTLKGDFDSIGEMWGNLIINMIAQTQAAKLNKYLFGDLFSGGTNSGAIGANFSELFKFLGFMSVGTDYVPQDGLAYLHRGERVVTADDNRKGAWGRGGQVVNNVQFVYQVEAGMGRQEVISALQLVEQRTEAKTMERLRRVGMA